MEKLVRRTGAGRSRLSSDHGRIGPAVELTVRASFSQLEVLRFEGSLARKLCLHIFHLHPLADFEGGLASVSHLQLSLFEGSLARKLRFHIFHFHFLREVSHEIRF